MTETILIPKILVYEEFDGHPIYRKGYKDFMLGLKTIEEINIGTSTTSNKLKTTNAKNELFTCSNFDDCIILQ